MSTTFYGESGVMKEINGKAQCHVCGRAFHHLGNHVARTHEITADEYRQAYGLNRGTGLISDALAEKRRQVQFRRIAEGWMPPAAFKKGVDWSGRKHPYRIQGKLHPNREQNIARLSQINATRLRKPRACVVCGAKFFRKAGGGTKTCSNACFRTNRAAHARAQGLGISIQRPKGTPKGTQITDKIRPHGPTDPTLHPSGSIETSGYVEKADHDAAKGRHP